MQDIEAELAAIAEYRDHPAGTILSLPPNTRPTLWSGRG
jgi:hypothetical protein